MTIHATAIQIGPVRWSTHWKRNNLIRKFQRTFKISRINSARRQISQMRIKSFFEMKNQMNNFIMKIGHYPDKSSFCRIDKCLFHRYVFYWEAIEFLLYFKIPSIFSEYFDFFNELIFGPFSSKISRENKNRIAERQYLN